MQSGNITFLYRKHICRLDGRAVRAQHGGRGAPDLRGQNNIEIEITMLKEDVLTLLKT